MKSFNGYKKCSHCDCIYPIIMFWKNKSSSDGLSYECKDCVEERRKSNLEKRAEYTRKWRDNNLEYAREQDRKRYQIRLENGDFTKSQRTYRKTEKGKLNVAKGNHKRYTQYKIIELFENPFPEDIKVEYHHINDILVIPMPKDIHKRYAGRTTNKHRKLMEKEIYKLYGLDIIDLLKEE